MMLAITKLSGYYKFLLLKGHNKRFNPKMFEKFTSSTCRLGMTAVKRYRCQTYSLPFLLI